MEISMVGTETPTPASPPWIYNTSSGTVPLDQEIFETAVILIGMIGMLANGTVLYVFGTSKQLRKQEINILFINQLLLDLFCSCCLIVVYSFKMARIYLDGSSGYWLCIFILSEDISYFGIYGSKLNLISIAMERYIKIVHPVWHKNNFRSWMTYLAALIPWVVSVSLTQFVTSWSTAVVDGQCWWGKVWTSDSAKFGFPISIFFITFVLPLASFLFCYSGIIRIVRQRAKVVALQRVSNHLAKNNNTQDMFLQMKAVKTMIIISVAFVICWLPCDLYSLITVLCIDANPATVIYYTLIFAGYLNICMNPFIYAFRYDGMKNHLVCLRSRSCFSSEVEKSTSINVMVIS
jgi:7 transmembrane receptor (rhodopsin family)